jgi:hypothetical protein
MAPETLRLEIYVLSFLELNLRDNSVPGHFADVVSRHDSSPTIDGHLSTEISTPEFRDSCVALQTIR